MNICIVGCGAIGSIYGAHLAMQDDINVWAYDKDQAHVDAINENGLSLKGVFNCVAEVRATTDPTDIPACDAGIITTKGYFTRDAISATAHLFKDGYVCSMQNGVGNEEIITEFVDHVISGTVLFGGHIEQPGLITVDTNGVTKLGAYHGEHTPNQTQQLSDLFQVSGLEVEVLSNPKGLKWTKLIFNAAANPVCALTRLSFGQAFERPDLRKLMFAAALEGIAVAQALSIELESDPITLLEEAMDYAYDHTPSMLSDVLAGRRTEIDFLNGGITQFGEQQGVPCPVNEMLVALISGVSLSLSAGALKG